MYQKDINITNDYLNLMNLESIGEYSNWVSQLGTNWFYEDNEHYKLLAYLSMFFENETIVDIGTYMGLSALAMSYNHKNVVITYDIVDNFERYKNELTVEKKDNIECRIKDCRDDVELFKNTNLVMLDVDPQNTTGSNFRKDMDRVLETMNLKRPLNKLFGDYAPVSYI